VGPGSLLRFVISLYDPMYVRSGTRICDWRAQSGTGTHLSEQRRCYSARARLDAQMMSEKKRNAQGSTEKMNWKARGGTGTHLRCTSISSHMPLLRSKLRSVTVAEDHVITSTASKMREPFELASKVNACANSNA
jgi:hypothetical protein